jgi:hypothetical protein
MLFVQHSLIDVPCLTLLLFLLLLAQHYCYFRYSLLDIACSMLLLQHCLFNIPCSTLLLFLLIFVWHSLFDTTLVAPSLMLFVQCSLFNIACLVLLVRCYCCSLFDATCLALLVDVGVVIATPYSTLLFF